MLGSRPKTGIFVFCSAAFAEEMASERAAPGTGTKRPRRAGLRGRGGEPRWPRSGAKGAGPGRAELLEGSGRPVQASLITKKGLPGIKRPLAGGQEPGRMWLCILEREAERFCKAGS